MPANKAGIATGLPPGRVDHAWRPDASASIAAVPARAVGALEEVGFCSLDTTENGPIGRRPRCHLDRPSGHKAAQSFEAYKPEPERPPVLSPEQLEAKRDADLWKKLKAQVRSGKAAALFLTRSGSLGAGRLGSNPHGQTISPISQEERPAQHLHPRNGARDLRAHCPVPIPQNYLADERTPTMRTVNTSSRRARPTNRRLH